MIRPEWFKKKCNMFKRFTGADLRGIDCDIINVNGHSCNRRHFEMPAWCGFQAAAIYLRPNPTDPPEMAAIRIRFSFSAA
jgi:hypothetical protein